MNAKPNPQRRRLSQFEPLEPRLALATLLNPTMLQFADVDGDRVVVSFTHGMLSIDNFTFTPAGAGEQLQTIDIGVDPPEAPPPADAPQALADGGLAGADLTVAVTKRGRHGDGLVNVGFIDATGIDLGKIRVRGDLGRIIVGDSDGSTEALEQLDVNSLGRAGLATQEPDGSLFSEITGSVGTIRVRTNVIGALAVIESDGGGFPAPIVAASSTTSAFGIGLLYVGGSIRGGEGFASGRIHCDGDIGEAYIVGSIRGGAGDQSGQLAATGNIGNLHVGGSLLGGMGAESGVVYAGRNLASAYVKGDVRGAAGEGSGSIAANTIDRLVIDGSLVGGAGESSGQINTLRQIFFDEFPPDPASDQIGYLRIGNDVRGGDGFSSGVVRSTRLDRLIVGDDMKSGPGFESGAVMADRIGHVFVHGSLVGMPGTPVQISAAGFVGELSETRFREEQREIVVVIQLPDGTFREEVRTITIQVPFTITVFINNPGRIDSLTVLGAVQHANIVAGINGSIDSVLIAGNWMASNLAAGVQRGNDGLFGTDDDELLFDSEHASPKAGRIDRVFILGRISGTSATGDHFGFVAKRIDKFFTLLGGGFLNLHPGAGNDDIPLGPTGDVRLRETTLFL
jgi:hypothetical protein